MDIVRFAHRLVEISWTQKIRTFGAKSERGFPNGGSKMFGEILGALQDSPVENTGAAIDMLDL